MDEKERKELEESIDATVEEMKKKIDEISASVEDVEDEDVKAKVMALKDKTVEVITGSMDKLVTMAKDVKDSEQFKKTVDFVKTKSKDLADATIKKINEIKDNPEVKEGFNKAVDGAKDLGSKVVDKAKEIKDSPELKEGLDKIGDTFKGLYDSAMENENVNKVVTTIGDTAGKLYDSAKTNVDEYFSRPEVQEKIEKAKGTTVDTAQKAVDALRSWLYPEKGDNTDEQKEE